jgi:DNA primase
VSGRFSPDTVERVKESADIVEIISAHTDLRRQGQRFTGLCPFHEERTPSFSVDPREKLYHCFGCGVGGDVIKFVEEKEGLAFPEAVEALGERYGVEVEREAEDPRAEEARKRRARLWEVLERTAAFYVTFLWDSPKAAKARAYLEGRGLGEDVLRSFSVGYAPSAWDQVLTRGQRAGFSVEELRAAGLVQKGRQGGFYDRFRSRITFPVRDPRGRVLGFGARGMTDDAKPKYLNSPEGELYRKSRTLFGIDRARGAIARAGRAVVVEGYTDVLALHQAGVEEAIAVMGTAITTEQLQLLAGHAEEVVLAMDADRAGRDAMVRAQRVAGAKRMRLRVAAMPPGEDPADMLSDGPAERFVTLVDEAVDLPVFEVESALAAADMSSPAGRDRALDEVVPVLAAMEESISRDELVRRVADRLDADPGLVARRVERGRGGGDGSSARQPAAAPQRGAPAPSAQTSGNGQREALSARELQERALLAMCIASPKEGREILARLTPDHLSSPVVIRAWQWLSDHLDAPMTGLPRDDELVSLITNLVMTSERDPGSRESMELNLLQLEQHMLEDRLGAARERGDDAALIRLSRERAGLAERIARGERPA